MGINASKLAWVFIDVCMLYVWAMEILLRVHIYAISFEQVLSHVKKKCWNLVNWLKYLLVTKLIFTNRIHSKFVNRTIRNDDILLLQTGCSWLEYDTKDQSPGFWIPIDWTNWYNSLLTSMWVCNFKLGKKKTVFRAYNKPTKEKTDFTGAWNLVS